MANEIPAEKYNKGVTILKNGSILEMILTVIHYVAGIYTNLFVDIPTQNPLSILFQWQDFTLLLHISTGLLMLGILIVMLYYSVKIHQKTFEILNLTNTILVGLGIHAGATFYLYGQNDYFSLWMATIYIAAVLIDFGQYILIRNRLCSNNSSQP